MCKLHIFQLRLRLPTAASVIQTSRFIRVTFSLSFTRTFSSYNQKRVELPVFLSRKNLEMLKMFTFDEIVIAGVDLADTLMTTLNATLSCRGF